MVAKGVSSSVVVSRLRLTKTANETESHFATADLNEELGRGCDTGFQHPNLNPMATRYAAYRPARLRQNSNSVLTPWPVAPLG